MTRPSLRRLGGPLPPLPVRDKRHDPPMTVILAATIALVLLLAWLV